MAKHEYILKHVGYLTSKETSLGYHKNLASAITKFCQTPADYDEDYLAVHIERGAKKPKKEKK